MENEGKKKTNKRAMKENQENNGKRTYIGVSVDAQLWERLRAQVINKGINSGPLLGKAIEKYLLKNE